jgi:ribose transport system permease protein
MPVSASSRSVARQALRCRRSPDRLAAGGGALFAVNGFCLGAQPQSRPAGIDPLMLAMPMTLIIMSEGLDLRRRCLKPVQRRDGRVAGGRTRHRHALARRSRSGLLGIANGAMVSLLALPPFVVTLGTLGIAEGASLVLTEGNAVSGLGSA